MGKRKIEVLELDDGKTRVETEALDYERAEDLLPEVASIVSMVIEAVAPAFSSGKLSMEDDILRILPLIGGVASSMGGGRLKRLSGPIMSTTVVTVTDDKGEKTKHELISKEGRASLFNERPDLYFRVLFHAGKATFARFFPASALSTQGSAVE